jgi:hypothetical protein
VVDFAVICPQFGANAGQLALLHYRDQSTDFLQLNAALYLQQHEKSVAGNVIVGVLDIICNVLCW